MPSWTAGASRSAAVLVGVDVAAASTASGVPAPASAATASSWRVPASNRVSERSSTSPITPPLSGAASSSRTNSGLPPVRACNSPASTGEPGWVATSRRTAATSRPPRRMNWDTRRSDSSWGMSGSWSRLVATNATRPSPSARGSCSSTHTAIESAQCRSSSTTMVGADERNAPASESRCSHLLSVAGSAGSFGGSTSSDRYTLRHRPIGSRTVASASPCTTPMPVALAMSAASSARRVLPIPGSPTNRTMFGRPAAAASRAACTTASSRSRPTTTSADDGGVANTS